ncbi:MAG: hypothetical protein HUU25_00505 [Candidatus Sumerlaeia bacterium]|nr:hypothetical protein [Candidatus Sumerlaeia bacterium]
MRLTALSLALSAMALGAAAQPASNGTVRFQTAGIASSGGVSASGNRLVYASIGQVTPLPAAVSMNSAGGRVQPGLIPQLYPQTLPGDANVDLRIDAADIVTVDRMVQGSLPQPTNVFGLYNVDLNVDGVVTATDIQRLADRILGL